MRVSKVAPVGPKKKKEGKKRAEGVNAQTVAEPEDGRKRARRTDRTEFKNPERALQMAELFPDQSLEERDGLLWCAACSTSLRFNQKKSVRQHLFGQRQKGMDSQTAFVAKSEEEKLKLGHYFNLVELKAAKKRATLVEEATKLTAKGSTLPLATSAARAEVYMTLVEVGIPIAKLENPKLVRLIEKEHPSLGGLSGMRTVQPVVRRMVLDSVKVAVKGLRLAVTFDGSKVNFSIEGMLARFLNDDFMPTSLCIGVKALQTSPTASIMRTLIKNHLAEAGVAIALVVAFCSDSGPPNPTAMSEWNSEASALYFGQELVDNCVLWLPCLMHAFSNAGTVLRKALVPVKKFMGGFKTMVNESSAGREAFARHTQQSCPGLSEKTFWAWYRRATPLLDVWQLIPPFLREAKQRTLAVKSVNKMAEAWAAKTLRAELIFCKAFGKTFHDASFELEGDGFCLPYVYQHIALVLQLKAEVERDRVAFRLLSDAVHNALADGLPPAAVDDFIKRLQRGANSVLEHFDRAVMSKMKDLMPLFRAAGLFEPRRFMVERSKPTFGAERGQMLDLLAGLKGVQPGTRSGLDAEFLQYEIEVRNRLNELQLNPSLEAPSQLWMWWRGLRLKLPNFFEVASVLVLLQPSSAAIERFFATVKANSSEQQNGETPESLEVRSMCVYNNG